VTSLPKILYKYCDVRGVDILLHHRLKVTPFNEFNDPFELAPRMRSDFNVEDARGAIADLDFQREAYKTAVAQGKFAGSFEDFRAMVSLVTDDVALKLVGDYPEKAARFRLSHMSTINRQFGLICLSEVSDDILMWSHYTRGHSGFVIGFDTANEFFAHPPVH
jgi:hypothetical protein